MNWLLHISMLVFASAGGNSIYSTIDVPFADRATCLTSLHLIEDRDGLVTRFRSIPNQPFLAEPVYNDSIDTPRLKVSCSKDSGHG